jgi:ABC-type ATPase involved in cell division
VIELESVAHRYGNATAVEGIDLRVRAGEFVVLSGPSGAGKSTLLRVIAGLLRPSAGRVVVSGQDLSRERRAAPWLRQRIGLVFQELALLDDRSALDNVRLPLDIAGISARPARDRARAALACVGLAERERLRPGQFSGGERQRLALARAIVHAPALLLADEPTARLDPAASRAVSELLHAQRDAGATVVVASHDTVAIDDPRVRCIRLEHGHIVEDLPAARADALATAAEPC